MLPGYDTCVTRINSYISSNYTSKGLTYGLPGRKVGFHYFWSYKTSVESSGGSILSDNNLSQTALNLRKFLITWKMGITGVAGVNGIEHILMNIRPYYEKIRSITLGSGKIHRFRNELACVYEGLGGITNNVDYTGNVSAIVGKSKTLVAIWGQIPAFDSINRKNFVKWTHPPAPLMLPHLRIREIWYKSNEFCDMIFELDNWISKWPANNSGRIFSQSFSNLCPNTPVGRIIDMIYNQK